MKDVIGALILVLLHHVRGVTVTQVHPFFVLPNTESIERASIDFIHPVSLLTHSVECKFHFKTLPLDRTHSEMKSEPLIRKPDVLGRLSGICLTKESEFWTFKVCFENKVTQFHEDISFNLGTYAETTNTDNAAQIFQRYRHGSTCDGDKDTKSRHSSVEFFCGDKFEIFFIDETEICEYVFFVSTPLVCGVHGFVQKVPAFAQNEDQVVDESEGWAIKMTVYDELLTNKNQVQCIVEKVRQRSVPPPENFVRSISSIFPTAWDYEFESSIIEQYKLGFDSFDFAMELHADDAELTPVYHHLKNNAHQPLENTEYTLSSEFDDTDHTKVLKIMSQKSPKFLNDVSLLRVVAQLD